MLGRGLKVVIFCLILVATHSALGSAVHINANQSSPHSNCRRLFEATTKASTLADVTIVGLSQRAEHQLLASTIRAYLAALGDLVTIPFNLNIGVFTVKEISYNDGTIATRYPYFKDWDWEKDEPIGEFKSHEDSIAIALHELTHQVLERYIIHAYSAIDPVVVWSFLFHPDDLSAIINKSYLEKTKHKTVYKDYDLERLSDLFFEVSNDSLLLNEFLADMGPIIFYNDPEAIYRGINFESDGDINHHRRVNISLSTDDIEKVRDSAHVVTIFARVFFWDVIHRKLVRESLDPMSFTEIMKSLVRVMIKTLPELSDGYKNPRTLARDVIAVNKILIRNMCAEFNITHWVYPPALLQGEPTAPNEAL